MSQSQKRQDAQIAIALAKSGRGAAPAPTPARGFQAALNVGPLPLATLTALTTVTVTPATTGRLRVIITGAAHNDGGAPESLFALLQKGDLSGGFGGNTVTVAPGGDASFALVVDMDLGLSPIVYPLGVPVTLAAAAEAFGSDLTVTGVQMSVQEVGPP